MKVDKLYDTAPAFEPVVAKSPTNKDFMDLMHRLNTNKYSDIAERARVPYRADNSANNEGLRSALKFHSLDR